MAGLKDIKMKPKLISLFLLVGLIPLIAIGIFSLNKAADSLEEESLATLTAVQKIKANQISNFFNERMGDVEVYAFNSAVQMAMTRFENGFDEAGGPFGPTWEKWDKAHGPKLRQYMDIYGYYDIFLISNDGDVVWTGTAEADLGENLVSGKLSNSGLARAFKNGSKRSTFTDFSWYGPSNDAAAFVSSPMVDLEGKTVGVLAYQISLESINNIMHERSGMGETGETYLVASDLKMRSDSFLDPEGHSVKASISGTVERNGVDTEATREAFNGRDGAKIITDYNGNPVYSVYSAITLPSGIEWAAIAEKDVAEVKQPVYVLRNIIFVIGLVIAVLVTVLAFFVAVGIANPLSRLTKSAIRLSKGNLEDKITLNQKDELGNLADAFRDLIDNLLSKAEAAEEISKGNLKADISVASDDDRLGLSMVQMREQINKLIQEMNHMSKEHDKGDIDVIMPLNEFEGAYREMADGVNNMVNGHISVKKKSMACIKEFGLGNFDAELEKFPGKKAFINDTIEMVRENLKAMIYDVNDLIQASMDGKLDTRADTTKHDGDFEKMIDGINNILDAVIKPVQEAAGVLDKMAEGDLSARVTGHYKGDHAKIKHALNNTLDSLNETLGQVNVAIDQVNGGATQVSSASQALSQGATEQAASLEEVSSSMTEVGAQVQQNAENASQANQLSDAAGTSAERGNAQMQDMLAAMDDINDSSNQIQKIIKVIDEIAFQTNLLALNAAVEAARAGVHGKGFAVVAEEVRNLAQRSAKAASETTELIEGSVAKAENGSNIAQETAKALEEILQQVSKVSDLIGEINAGSAEQNTAIKEISESLGQIDQVTQGNTANAEESAAAAEELAGQSSHLSEMISRFRLSNGNGDGNDRHNINELPSYSVDRRALGDGNGKHQKGKQVQPAELINLDDSDFGDF